MRGKEDENPIIMFGQDGCIVKEYLFTNKYWALPNINIPPMPKEEDQGIILSSFVSRELGYGFEMISSQLAHINEYKKGSTSYMLMQLWKLIKKQKKPNFTPSPFMS